MWMFSLNYTGTKENFLGIMIMSEVQTIEYCRLSASDGSGQVEYRDEREKYKRYIWNPEAYILNDRKHFRVVQMQRWWHKLFWFIVQQYNQVKHQTCVILQI